MQYKAYAKAKDTPSRKQRKNSRCSTFVFNKKLARVARKARRVARREAEEN